jgi:hypothetical protein
MLIMVIVLMTGCERDMLVVPIINNISIGLTDNNLKIYFTHSIKTNVTFYLNESDADTIETYTAGGDKFIFGGDFI